MNANTTLYPIGEVANLTGVNPITLRAWERRYGLIDPVRTEGGHRLYSLEHLEMIKQAVELTQQGIPISQVKAHLSKIKSKPAAQELDSYSTEHKVLLLQAVQSADSELLSLALDNAFIDLSDGLVLKLIWQTTQEIYSQDNDIVDLQLTLWSSQILPRLYNRLHFIRRNQKINATKRLWLQAVKLSLPSAKIQLINQIGCVIAAIKLAEKGVYSLLNLAEISQENLIETIKLSKCEGLVLFNLNGDTLANEWKAWIASYPSLELHYIVGSETQILSTGLDITSNYSQSCLV